MNTYILTAALWFFIGALFEAVRRHKSAKKWRKDDVMFDYIEKRYSIDRNTAETFINGYAEYYNTHVNE